MKNYKQNQVVALSILTGGAVGAAIGATAAHYTPATPDTETTLKVAATSALLGGAIAGCIAVVATGPSDDEIAADERRERIYYERMDAIAKKELGSSDPALKVEEKKTEQATASN